MKAGHTVTESPTCTEQGVPRVSKRVPRVSKRVPRVSKRVPRVSKRVPRVSKRQEADRVTSMKAEEPYRKGEITKLLFASQREESLGSNMKSTDPVCLKLFSRRSEQSTALATPVVGLSTTVGGMDTGRSRNSVGRDHPRLLKLESLMQHQQQPSEEMKRRLDRGLKRAREVEEEFRMSRRNDLSIMGENEDVHHRGKRAKHQRVLPDDPLESSHSQTDVTGIGQQLDVGQNPRSSGGQRFSNHRGLTEEERKEETCRTVFVGSVPVRMKDNELFTVLGISPSEVQSIRFRSIPVDPKFSKHRQYAANAELFTGTCDFKNAYIVLKNAEGVRKLIAKNGVLTPSNVHLRITSVSFKRDEFSAFPRRATVFVGNLHTKTGESDLWKAFEAASVGPVVNVRVVRDPKIYVTKGFGFVQLADRAQVAKAIKVMHGHTLNGRPLNVTKALDEKGAKEIDSARQQLVDNKIKKKRVKKTKVKVANELMKKGKLKSAKLVKKTGGPKRSTKRVRVK